MLERCLNLSEYRPYFNQISMIITHRVQNRGWLFESRSQENYKNNAYRLYKKDYNNYTAIKKCIMLTDTNWTNTCHLLSKQVIIEKNELNELRLLQSTYKEPQRQNTPIPMIF